MRPIVIHGSSVENRKIFFDKYLKIYEKPKKAFISDSCINLISVFDENCDALFFEEIDSIDFLIGLFKNDFINIIDSKGNNIITKNITFVISIKSIFSKGLSRNNANIINVEQFKKSLQS